MPMKIKEFGDLIDKRIMSFDSKGIIIDLADLKWLVEEPSATIVPSIGRDSMSIEELLNHYKHTIIDAKTSVKKLDLKNVKDDFNEKKFASWDGMDCDVQVIMIHACDFIKLGEKNLTMLNFDDMFVSVAKWELQRTTISLTIAVKARSFDARFDSKASVKKALQSTQNSSDSYCHQQTLSTKDLHLLLCPQLSPRSTV
ncbi:hypothetical protein L1887_39360 [Cichorium endivia]|nr:hypothetical protein L1887_39360 [Cichorium endivia]